MVSREVASGTARPQKMYLVSERAKHNVGSRGASATKSALRLGLDQWRHTGLVTGVPPANSESEEVSESPGPVTHLVLSHRAKCPRPKGTGLGGRAAGAAAKGPGSAGAGGEKQQRARRGLGLAQGRSGAPAVLHGLPRGRQWHCPSTEDVRRFRESESQRGLAGRQRDEAERQEEARHALITGRREVSMSWEEVAAAVARGFKSAQGLVTSSLRGLGNRRGAALVDAANRSGHRSTGLPESVRGLVCCGANECAGDQLNKNNYRYNVQLGDLCVRSRSVWSVSVSYVF